MKAQQMSEAFIEDITLKLRYYGYYIVIPVTDSATNYTREALVTNSQLYHVVYKPTYKGKHSFKDFFLKVSNKEILIEIKDLGEVYHLYTEIQKENSPEFNSIDDVLKKHFEESKPSVYKLLKYENINKLYDLIRLFFYNEFRITFDSYEGYYYFYRTSPPTPSWSDP